MAEDFIRAVERTDANDLSGLEFGGGPNYSSASPIRAGTFGTPPQVSDRFANRITKSVHA